MSYVTIVWSVAAAAALLLAMVHVFVRWHDPQARSNLSFAVVAFALVGVAITELGMMYSETPSEWGWWVRWCHLPLFFLFCGILFFVHQYLGTGRPLLMWATIAGRFAILIANFTTGPNFNFARIDAIGRVPVLGEPITVVTRAEPSSWQWVAVATCVLCLAFIIDAAFTCWRTGTPEMRRKAAIVGGGTFMFAAVAVVYTQIVIWGAVRLPMLITPAFSILLIAMGTELNRDVLRATRLAREMSERRLELAANAAGLGLWSFDTASARIWATSTARSMFGFGKSEPIDVARLGSIVHADDAPRVLDTVRQALAMGREYVLQFRIRLHDGAIRWIIARGSSEREASGDSTLVRGVVLDVTDQKQAQDEADKLRVELAHAGRVTMVGQLASALAHELRQPLGAILRNAEAAGMLLERAHPDLDEIRAIIADIHADDRRAGEVIDRLRALLQRQRMEFQPIVLGSLLQEVSSLVRFDAAARHVTLQLAIESPLPAVSGDRVHLSQVLINLIINGMDAIVDSSCGQRRVIVEARAGHDDSVEVAVTDSGAGIAPESMKRIFEPFFTTKAGGMGLGLCISRAIIEAHGGRLWAENSSQGGATFRIALPAATAEGS
jgi:PAS domain S-box-containing protein